MHQPQKDSDATNPIKSDKDNPSTQSNQYDKVLFRSAMSQASSYRYERTIKKNIQYSGNAFINCSRIIAKDKLDRFIIDDKINDYFISNFHGLENLPEHNSETILRILKNTNSATSTSDPLPSQTSLLSNLLQPSQRPHHQSNNAFAQCRSLKLGKMHSKLTRLDLYNVEIKATLNTAETLYALQRSYQDTHQKVILNDMIWKRSQVFPEFYTVTIGNLSSHGISEE